MKLATLKNNINIFGAIKQQVVGLGKKIC